MGLNLYRCSDDFPERIPELLAVVSPEPACERIPHPALDADSGFCYLITRGKARIKVYGAPEDGMMILTIVDGSPGLLSRLRHGRAGMELANDVTRVLLDAGMTAITVEDIEELEAKEREKEEERTGSFNGG